MAPIRPESKRVRGGFLDTWALKADEIGEQTDCSFSSRQSVQVGGDFSGGVLQIEGSNDGREWYDLHDLLGITLTWKSPRLRAISEYVMYVRPVVKGGGPSTLITVTLLSSVLR